MSMKPGATMRPRASRTRAASPARFGPDRGDAIALDGDVGGGAGAPLPSTTVPFLIRSDQAISAERASPTAPKSLR